MKKLNIMKYFTKQEIEAYKNNSLNFPSFLIENDQDEVIQVDEIVSMSGMAYNNGIPTEFTILSHRKDAPTKTLIYSLTTTNVKNEDSLDHKKNWFEMYTNEKHEVTLKKVYTEITLETEESDTFSICMRDGGFEFKYNNESYIAKNGKIEKLKSTSSLKTQELPQSNSKH